MSTTGRFSWSECNEAVSLYPSYKIIAVVRAELKHTNLFLFAIVRGHACYLHVNDIFLKEETSSFLHF